MFFGFMNKDYNTKRRAYTLAEMLVVLVIISVVLISLPHATKKLFAVKEVKSYHGRFECYWDNAGNLKYYYAKERPGLPTEIKEGDGDDDGKCEFIPPITYPYIMIHAVGGGGAGGNLTGEVPVPSLFTAYTEYSRDENDGTWDRWFSNAVHGMSGTDKANFGINAGTRPKDVYSTLITANQIPLEYRKAGGAGLVSSMFFPFIPAGNKFYLYPGKGGALQAQDQNGEDGKASVVQIVVEGQNCDKDDANAACNIVWARGGKGATVVDDAGNIINLVSNILLTGGKHSDYGLSAYSDVKARKSGFGDIIDKVNSSENFESKISEDAGDGGNGANHYVSTVANGFFFHEFDDFYRSPAKDQGVKWVPISGYIDGSATYSSDCVNYDSGLSGRLGLEDGFWITRSSRGDISTQCTPNNTATEYNCAVGYMLRNVPSTATNFCNWYTQGGIQGYRCATFKFNSNGDLISSTNNYNGSTEDYYRNPQLLTDASGKKYMTVEEKIPDNSSHIFCSGTAGNKYSIDGVGTPCEGNTNFGGGICRAKKGGDGAIVILW